MQAPGTGLAGSYLLRLLLPSSVDIEVGRAGCHHFVKGSYLYVGSALGPGGVRARLGHHLKQSTRLHWHIDYLRQHAEIDEIWFVENPQRLEHRWAEVVTQLPGCQLVTPGLGASDCGCITHLFYFEVAPQVQQLQLAMDGAGDNSLLLQRWQAEGANHSG